MTFALQNVCFPQTYFRQGIFNSDCLVQEQELYLMILVGAFQLQDILYFYDPNPNQHLDETFVRQQFVFKLM